MSSVTSVRIFLVRAEVFRYQSWWMGLKKNLYVFSDVALLVFALYINVTILGMRIENEARTCQAPQNMLDPHQLTEIQRGSQGELNLKLTYILRGENRIRVL